MTPKPPDGIARPPCSTFPRPNTTSASSTSDGIGVPQDYTQAADLYRRAAEQGNASAQFNLALLYDNGTGLARDYAQAAAWYTKAAEQGLPRAQFNLGSMYANGQGVPVNLVESYVWLDLAARTWTGHASRKPPRPATWSPST